MTNQQALRDIRSYRPALKELIEAFGDDGMRALNEPSHVECGAPDFIVEFNGVPIGHVECKNVGADLEQVGESHPTKAIPRGLPNLILTDYLEFRWYGEGSLRESERLGRLNSQAGSYPTTRARFRLLPCWTCSSLRMSRPSTILATLPGVCRRKRDF